MLWHYVIKVQNFEKKDLMFGCHIWFQTFSKTRWPPTFAEFFLSFLSCPHSEESKSAFTFSALFGTHTNQIQKTNLKNLNQTDFLIFSAFLLTKLRTFNILQMFPSSRPIRCQNKKLGRFEFSCQKSVFLETDSRFH